MTNTNYINFTSTGNDLDDAEGRSARRGGFDDGARKPGDDAEGHALRSPEPAVDDAEGHGRHLPPAGDDAEGDVMKSGR